MSHSGTRISAPVEILGDLQPVLGTTLKNVMQIIQQAPINKWAFCKPFRDEANNYPSGGSRNAARGGQGGAGDGLNIPNTGYTATWEYLRPTGGIGVSPGRVLDFVFDGYEHASTVPLSITWQNEKVQYPSGGASFTGRCSFGVNITVRAHDGVQTSIADLFNSTELSQLYFILVITTSKGSYYARLRGGSSSVPSPIGTILSYGGGGVTIDTANAYDILYGTTQATVSLIVAGLDSDGLNKNLTTRAYSMCCEPGLATATKTVEAVTTTWYQGLHATASMSAAASGNTAHITGISLGLAKDSGAAASGAYYRVQLNRASATSITGGGQTHTEDHILLGASSAQYVSFPSSPSLPSTIFNGYTWNYQSTTPKVISVVVYFYQNLTDAQNHTNYFSVSASKSNI